MSSAPTLNAQTKPKKSSPAKPKATSKPKSVKAATHPPFADIIRACIAETGDRTGVSRATIKRFIEDKYKMEVTPAVVSNINRSITYGAEKGTFVLPKGPSGKVKLAPKKSSSDAAKENAKPTKPTSTKKPVAKPAAAKRTIKQASKPTKKVTTVKKATKAPAKRVTSKKPSAKTVLTGSGKAKPTSPKVKTAVKKKVTATAASKKPKATKAKPASTKAASAAKPASKK